MTMSEAPPFEELAKGGEQLLDIVEVQAGGGLVENVKHAGIGGVHQMRGELEALGFAAGKRGGGLAEAQIAEADFVEDLELGSDLGDAGEKVQGLAHGEAAELRECFCRGSALRGRALLKRVPRHSSQMSSTSARNCISTVTVPSPWQASQRPPGILKEKWPARKSAALGFGSGGEGSRMQSKAFM